MDRFKMLPIGIEDFKEIITQNFYYIDKTNMINELLNNWSKVNLFTRPRRFGKSLNMSMLRYFFEIGTDHTLFNGLKISDEKEICKEYMGKFPVISISLKDVSGANFSKAVYKLKSIIRNESLRHQYLMESTVLSKYDKAEFEPLIASEMSDETLEQSLMILSRTLNKHHTQKVIILIDEYDVPLSKAYEYGYYDDMIMLIRGILEYSLKTNENLKLAVLTGCMRISKESIFTGMNNFKIRSVTDVKFDEYFGFTDNEVKNLLKQYHFEEKYDAVKQWYNGYKFGKVSVYCPWDVINYIDDLNETPDIVPQNYWLNTSGNDIIRRFLDKADETTKWELEQLISGETIEKEIYQEMTYAELDKTIDHLWSVLFTTGYLTYNPETLYAKSSEINFQKLSLKIPNEEIRCIFKNQIYKWFDDYVQTNADLYKNFSEAFMQGDFIKIEDIFNQYLSETISIRDTSVRKSMKENFYHGILLGILKYRNDWIIKSNIESGNGYSDIIINCKSKKIGIVIEVKYAENNDLNSECQNALKQINKLLYTSVLKEYEPTTIYKYGIACYKKQCKVISEKE
ncbi:MAG: hypothetical protein E7510_10750 [Ruminococcus sp.]|nr:hypothetical protein [Ruminococcus sp.]